MNDDLLVLRGAHRDSRIRLASLFAVAMAIGCGGASSGQAHLSDADGGGATGSGGAGATGGSSGIGGTGNLGVMGGPEGCLDPMPTCIPCGPGHDAQGAMCTYIPNTWTWVCAPGTYAPDEYAARCPDGGASDSSAPTCPITEKTYCHAKTNGVCSGVRVDRVCGADASSGAWACPDGTVPESECSCFGENGDAAVCYLTDAGTG